MSQAHVRMVEVSTLWKNLQLCATMYTVFLSWCSGLELGAPWGCVPGIFCAALGIVQRLCPCQTGETAILHPSGKHRKGWYMCVVPTHSR